MNLAEKQEAVEVLSKAFSSAQAAFLVDFTGITCEDLTGLRRKLKPTGGSLKVVKNTLARRALSEGDYSSLSDLLVGQTALIWSESDPVGSAKIVQAFAKEKEKFAVKGGVVDGAVVSAKDVEALASMPSKEQLLGKLLALINAPATRLLQTINAPGTNLVRLLEAWRVKQEKGE